MHPRYSCSHGPFMSAIVLDLYPILVASWKTNMWPWLKSPKLHTIRCSIDEMKEGRERILWPQSFLILQGFRDLSTLKCSNTCSNTLLMKATQQTTPLLSACTHSPTYALVSFPLSIWNRKPPSLDLRQFEISSFFTRVSLILANWSLCSFSF